jgi:diguanylate cyclase (GGDEF)-like protein
MPDLRNRADAHAMRGGAIAMLSVLSHTWQHHDHRLLLLAAAIWIGGSLSLFMLLQRSLEFGIRRRRQWLTIGAMTGGLGVWATHFVAMLAHRDGKAIAYDPGLTVVSIIVVIGCFWLALRIFAFSAGLPRQALAGLVAVAGVALMHFAGMAAMESGVRIHYQAAPIAWAALLSSACFAAAFIVFARTRGTLQIVAPALLAIVAVCAVHFTAMSATVMTMPCNGAVGADGLDRSWLITAIVAATGLLVAATAVAMLVDRYLTDMRGLAEATLEGLVIVHGDRIVEANLRFAQMLGIEPRGLRGETPARWLVAADGHALLAPRDTPVEAALATPGEVERSFEIAIHKVEYRGRDCTVLALRDLTEKKAAQRQIEHMARHDALTDLPNRLMLDERIAYGLSLARRDGQQLALIALDLDRFKAVNDIFGHAAGDDVLCRVARILAGAVRSTDTVARIGGDEFMILQVGAAQPEGAQALVGRIFAEFAREMDSARDPTAVGVSAGVAIYPNDAADAETLRHGADVALYRSKQSGRGASCFFDREMDAAVRERRALEHDLRHALPRRQIHIAFQPLVRTGDRRVTGYEALMRWDHPERGAVSPDIFVPIAEDTGAIVQLGEWILHEACRTAAGWADDLFLAVNVSPIQFQLPNLADIVKSVLDETGFPAHRLELEITETALMKDRDAVLATLGRLKAQGVRIVMDDFGTGYSSLSNLQSFPFDKIKIDRSFIAAMEDDAAARSIIRAIVGIGRSLSLPVVAEGVETEAQHRMVIEEGCREAQGYLFGRPERVMGTRGRRRVAASR